MDPELLRLTNEFTAVNAQIKALTDKPSLNNDELKTLDTLIETAKTNKAQMDERKAALAKVEEARKTVTANLAYLNQPAPVTYHPHMNGTNGNDTKGGWNSTTGRIEAGESEDDKTKSFEDFLVLISEACIEKRSDAIERLDRVYGSTNKKWSKETQRNAKTMYGSTGSSGGYLVPPEFYNRIMSKSGENAIIRPGAFVVPMKTNAIPIPMLNQSGVPAAGTTRMYGGVSAGWAGEKTTSPETEPSFAQDTLTAHELVGYTEVSRTLVQDSPISLEAFLYDLFAKAVAYTEDYAFLRGDGVGKPLGILNSPALVKTAARGNASNITFANATAMWVRLLAEDQDGAVWVASQAAQNPLFNMTGTANQVFIPSGFVTGDGGAAQAALKMMLFGRPVMVTSKMPALNSLGDFMLINRANYLIGDRNQLEIAASEHVKFRERQIAYVFVKRVGGMPWLQTPITLEDGTTTVSPFVALEIQ